MGKVADTFLEKYCYDITEYLPSVVKMEDCPQVADYWRQAGERKEIIESLGMPIIYATETYKVPEIVSYNVSYKGEGTPHFMRRALYGGEELVILANIEDNTQIC